jgi:hypothetical protein
MQSAAIAGFVLGIVYWTGIANCFRLLDAHQAITPHPRSPEAGLLLNLQGEDTRLGREMPSLVIRD